MRDEVNGIKDLFIETELGRMPIDYEVTERYGLNQGSKSPFSNNPIVGTMGDWHLDTPFREKAIQKDFKNTPIGEDRQGEEVVQMENGFEMLKSEIIDFAQGTDSSTE